MAKKMKRWTVAAYLRNKNARQNTLFRVKPDGTRFFVLNDGTEVPEQKFLKQHEIPVSLVKWNTPNPDGTQDWAKTV